jgi:hypothetical protein
VSLQPISAPEVALPAGAIATDCWQRSPNDGACYRQFAAKKFEALDRLSLAPAGFQLVEDGGRSYVSRYVKTLGSLPPRMSIPELRHLAQVLTETADYMAELQAADEAVGTSSA